MPVTSEPTDPVVPDPAKPGDGIDPAVTDAGKRAIAAEREAARTAKREATEARKALELAQRRIAEFEDQQKSELERAQAEMKRATEREHAANLRAVASDLRSAAIAADASDPSIVVDLLSRNLDRFLVDGGIDNDAIEKAVSDLLTAKPLLRKPEPSATPVAPATPPPTPEPSRLPAPAPDPGQGARPGTNTKPDWSDPATYDAEAKRLGLPRYGLRR